MREMLFYAHSGLRYVVILIFVLAIAKLLVGWLTGSKWSKVDQGLGAALPITTDIQFVLGLILWLGWSDTWFLGRGSVTVAEHLVTMLIVVNIAHYAWIHVKRASDDATKFRVGTVGYLIAGLLLTVGILRITLIV